MLQGTDTYSRGVDRELLRCWLAAKQMWNPRFNTTELVRDFTCGFYGPAAEPMQQYQDFLARTAEDNRMEPSLHYGSVPEVIFERPFIDTAMSYLDEAERLVGDDVDLRTRVRLAKVPVWYCQARRGPVDGLPAYHGVLDRIFDFATKEHGLQVLDWPSSSSCVSDVQHWRAIAEFDHGEWIPGCW